MTKFAKEHVRTSHKAKMLFGTSNIWFFNCKTIEMNLCNAATFPEWQISVINATQNRTFNQHSEVVNLECPGWSKKDTSHAKMQL